MSSLGVRRKVTDIEKSDLMIIKNRKTVFYCALTGIFAGMIFGFREDGSVWAPLGYVPYVVLFGVVLGVGLSLLFKKTSFLFAIYSMTVTAALAVAAEMLAGSVMMPQEAGAVLLSGLFRLGFWLAVAAWAGIPRLSYILAAVGMGSCVASVFVVGDAALGWFCLSFLPVFVAGAVLSARMVGVLAVLQEDVRYYRDERHAVLELFNVRDGQLSEFIRLAGQKRLSPDETGDLLRVLGREAEGRIRRNVDRMVRSERADYSRLEACLPQLTRTEQKVAFLILQGKTLSQIAMELLKTETNISVIRSNIRKKLNLDKKDNLYERLSERMALQEMPAEGSAVQENF